MASQLAVNVESGGATAHGCCTPKEDKTPQKMSVPPKRVLPIIFIPGIMGSNLRMSAKRQTKLKKSNNIAWRPDRKGEALELLNARPARRQLQLDPKTTEVDSYDPQHNPTGDPDETSAERNKIDKVSMSLNVGVDTPLLTDDVRDVPNRKTKEDKARERGWGEIYYSSYRTILEKCEQYLNSSSSSGLLREIFDVDPALWGAHPRPVLQPLSEAEYKKAVAGCWFPVHAMGYNWLRSNGDSAAVLGKRITALMAKYRSQGYRCEKVVLVTHSMGGLVARALIHPDMGALGPCVLGVVHGVMPAMGAPAAYKRIRSGTEEGYWGLDPTPKVLGNLGSEVTAVLGNAPGGLELLPSKAYGDGWLEIRQAGKLLKSLPEHGDPYSEIYQLKGKWFRLLREEWLNPARLDGCNFSQTSQFLSWAKEFHEQINSSYHALTYVHYGCDTKRASWEKVVWNLDPTYKGKDWQALHIFSDKRKGKFRLYESNIDAQDEGDRGLLDITFKTSSQPSSFSVELGESSGAGDQTVPTRSAEQQLLNGKCSGIFRQTGYEHQNSYQDDAAIKSTLFSLIRIAGTMKWSGNA